MLKRLLLSGAAACGLLLAAETAEPEVSFSTPSRIGTLLLPAGLYKVRVQGALVFLTETTTKKSYSALVKVEKTGKRAPFTAAQGRPIEGVQQVETILIEGGDYKLVF